MPVTRQVVFFLFVFVFAVIGNVLYGAELLEWSNFSSSMVTIIDIISGNYVFNQLIRNVAPDETFKYVMSVIFFYVYYFLMM